MGMGINDGCAAGVGLGPFWGGMGDGRLDRAELEEVRVCPAEVEIT